MQSDPLKNGLVGHWKFAGDARDHSGYKNHGRPHGVDFSAPGRSGKPGTAARFNGVDDCIEVKHHPTLSLGNKDFSIATWVRLDEAHDDVIGDIAGKYDPVERRGFNFYVTASSSGYNSHGDSRHLHFGIDNAMEESWRDCGALHPTNTFVSSLTAHDGRLYAAQADALGDGSDSCHVYAYAGGHEWEDCGRVSDDLRQRSAYSLIAHRGHLYCGTGQQDWQAAGPELCNFSHVYRYVGGREWEDLGQVGRNYRILGLASYKGDLYCGTDVSHPQVFPDSGNVFRYAGGQQWEDCGRLGEQVHTFALMVHNGELFGGCMGEIYRYLGDRNWEYLGQPLGNTQVHCLEVYRGDLWAGTWPQGYVLRYHHGQTWENGGVVGERHERTTDPVNEINDLTVHNGSFFAGVIPRGEVCRYEGGRQWRVVRRLLANPDYDPHQLDSWARVPSIAAFDGKLFASTGTCRGCPQERPHHEAGRIYSTQIGRAVSWDRDMGSGWNHVAAVRENDRLRLYLNGHQVACSDSIPASCYDLDTAVPMYLGFGAVDYFSGDMEDVRMYCRALHREDVATLASQSAGDSPW
ncbi:MAG: LamG-like jellyroll fold domain-containing protein [Candidatus Latescibacterota bacterium]|jgi:hypothetical protein|nr:hypothetical protein [Candidatus Latescibacterota bacterium]MEC8991842.1 LamG-like jellyroll fold domain-containing protein [Candidatus Latescibacterota bacterium]MEE3039516.1 LamG-like jellyroll fold domain-containing protein [Candidatus Latescibacterota bacterium]